MRTVLTILLDRLGPWTTLRDDMFSPCNSQIKIDHVQQASFYGFIFMFKLAAALEYDSWGLKWPFCSGHPSARLSSAIAYWQKKSMNWISTDLWQDTGTCEQLDVLEDQVLPQKRGVTSHCSADASYVILIKIVSTKGWAPCHVWSWLLCSDICFRVCFVTYLYSLFECCYWSGLVAKYSNCHDN